MSEQIRVLVVDDSATVRGHLTEVLSREPDVAVVAEATTGERAVELAARIRPDVITMDIVLPGMSGLAATEHIMAHCPTPILVVSSSTNRGELYQTCEALAAGAVDVLEKPDGRADDAWWEQRLVSAVRLVSRIRVITHPRARLNANGSARVNGTAHRAMPVAVEPVQAPGGTCEVVCVGASTGGPPALVEVLRALPDDYGLPVLLVLHINEPFSSAFVDWLGVQLGRTVRYPRDGELLSAAAGQVVMAPPDLHLVVRHGRLRLDRGPERHSCRPSVDVLFESVAHDRGAAATGVLLTGMGRDGAAGLLALRRAGARTVAQDEATCVVYGMPREAALLGAAEQILPVAAIGPAVTALTHRTPGGRT
jgi:two-component system chemotaxis response regulator CheB